MSWGQVAELSLHLALQPGRQLTRRPVDMDGSIRVQCRRADAGKRLVVRLVGR